MEIDLSEVDDETAPTESDIATAKATIAWLEDGQPAFVEVVHGDAKASVFNDSQDGTVVIAQVDGDQTARREIDEGIAAMVRAAHRG